MRMILALIAVGVFGFAGYAIAFRAIPPGSLATSVDGIARTLGHGLTGALVFCIGIVIAWSMIRARAERG